MWRIVQSRAPSKSGPDRGRAREDFRVRCAVFVMDPIILMLEIKELKAKVALCEIICAALEEKCSGERLSTEEKDEIETLLAAARIDGNELRAHLEVLEQE